MARMCITSGPDYLFKLSRPWYELCPLTAGMSLCHKGLSYGCISKSKSVLLSRPRWHFAFLDASSHLYMRVCPSVRRSVGRSVTLSSKTRKIIISEQINAQAGMLGSQDASLHLYKTVNRSVGRSVHYFYHASANINENQRFSSKQEVKKNFM